MLMLTLVHQMAAEWQMRSVSVVSKFPLKFMVCLETAHHADCSMRREVAEILLNSCDIHLEGEACLQAGLRAHEVHIYHTIPYTWKPYHIHVPTLGNQCVCDLTMVG